jgi:hypothetical protein
VTAKNGTSFRISAGHAEPLHDLESAKALQLGGNSRLVGNERYWALPSEGYVRDSDVVVLRKRQEFPSAIGKNTHFADLDLAQGALVLYEGKEPFYATLALRLPRSKPATTIAYVKSKQVTLLGAPSPEENTVARLDVAWAIELTCGLRLQAANSPLELAKPAPEGVIELHPEDAHRLFQWLEPAVPDTWHGVTVRDPEREGSPILLH